MKLFVEYLGLFILILNTILFGFGYSKRQRDGKYLIFTIYLFCISLIQIVSVYLAYFKQYNLFISHFYFIVQFVLLSIFYRKLLRKNQTILVDVIGVVVTIFLVFLFAIGKITYNAIEPFNPLEVFICSLPLILFSAIHFYNTLNSSIKYVYINSGILIYISISTLLFILGSFINANGYPDISFILWKMNSVFYLVYLSLIFLEWYKNFRVNKVR